MVTRWKTSKLHFLVINVLTCYMRHDNLNTRFFIRRREYHRLFNETTFLTHFQYINITLTFSEAAKAAGCFSPNYKTQVTLYWLNKLSNTTNLWYMYVYYIGINYMFRRLWPSSG